MADIHALPGHVTGERHVDEGVVETLEELLRAAKAGEVIGFSGAVCWFNEQTSIESFGMIDVNGVIRAFEQQKLQLLMTAISE